MGAFLRYALLGLGVFVALWLVFALVILDRQ
jgi:hypothetical protein